MPLVLPYTKTLELLEQYRPVSLFHELRYEILKRIERREDILPRIQGRREVKDDVARALLSGAHPYLVSLEGTGKTRLARSVSDLLGAVPKIAGCPYHDDPKWPRESLCPRCRSSADPVGEFGVEWIRGDERFSRVQGNEYTNESKLLGLKDIQAIASGMSPTDPGTFTGTGVFRANRGILFVDELPAIRTKVQVLLHPIIEERMAILEEYGWEYPLDLCVVATGNPEGFSHVNEVPRPLIDRLETIYMDLPDEETEFAIMSGERSTISNDPKAAPDQVMPAFAEALPRKALAPWWLLAVINKAARQSRVCRWVERASSIRGTMRALDHAYSSAELAGRVIAGLEDAAAGLKLALRGRVQLRQDLIDFENPRATMAKIDELSDDLVCAALLEIAGEVAVSWDRDVVTGEVTRLLRTPRPEWPGLVYGDSGRLGELIAGLERVGRTRRRPEGVALDDENISEISARDSALRDCYIDSALHFIAALWITLGCVPADEAQSFYIPRQIGWATEASWR